MKKHFTLFLASILVLFASATFAQKTKITKPKTPKLTIEQKATKNADSLKARLSLTDEQYAKVIPINVEFFTKRDEIRKLQKTDTIVANQAVYKAQTKTAYQTRRKAINAFLTQAQKDTWKAWKKTHVKNVKANKVKPSDDDIDGNDLD